MAGMVLLEEQGKHYMAIRYQVQIAYGLGPNSKLRKQAGQLAFAGFSTHASQTGSALLPFFGTNAQAMVYGSHTAGYSLELGGAGKTEIILDSSADIHDDMITIADSEKVTLGNTSIKTNLPSGGYRFIGSAVATPIHTSSHYQEFETPYLRELVGGDRNMEQNNLIVTSDGKSWDEVTRDTSYIGKGCLHADFDGSHANESTWVIWDEWRGEGSNSGSTGSSARWGLYNKDFAIAYDRVICLVDGQYSIYIQDQNSSDTSSHMQCYINGVLYLKAYSGTGHGMVNTGPFNVQLFRGDYIQIKGNFNPYANICTYEITRI